ncbi:MAG: flagellar motor switch protein FliG [Porticoccaceae bacterium]
MADGTALSGVQRAAIFLLGLGEEGAATVLKQMTPKEVQALGQAMASMSNVSDQQIAEVVHEFTEKVSRVSPLGIGAGDFTRRVMVQALGETKARSMLSKIDNGDPKGMESLKWMEASAVAGVIMSEHPQIIAIVLASLDNDHAAQVLALLPRDIMPEIMLRIARLDSVDPIALQELDRVLEKQLGSTQKISPSALNGMKTAAGILNNLDTEIESELMQSIKESDNELGEQIHDLMFVFDNLLEVDDRGMQRIIREISVDSLVIALKGVDDRVKEKFFKNMSSRAADMLREDLEAKGPVKLADVEAAQKSILSTVRRLADEGEIFLGKKGGGDFV